MNRYDPYTGSFISDDLDMRSYMLGYLAGCSDSLNKFKTMTDPKYTFVTDCIDNVPTVEAYTSEDIVKYISATEDLVREKLERPSGEWIIVKDKKWGDNVKCPFCGKELAGTDLNFCCKCGAKLTGSEKMNGGEEE